MRLKLQEIFGDVKEMWDDAISPKIEDLKAIWTPIFRQLFDDISGDTQVRGSLTDLFQHVLEEAVKSAAKNLADSLPPLMKTSFESALKEIFKPGALDLGDALLAGLGLDPASFEDLDVIPYIDVIHGFIGRIIEGLGPLGLFQIDAVQLGEQWGESIREALGNLTGPGGPFEPLIGNLAGLGQLFDDINKWMTDPNFGKGLEERLSSLGGGFAVMGGIVDGVRVILDVLRLVSMTNLSDYINNTLVPAIRDKWQNATETLHGAIEDLQEFLDGLFHTALVNLRNFVQNQIVARLSDWYDIAVDVLDNALTPLRNYIEDTLLNTLGTLGDFLGIDLLGAFTTIKNFIVENFNKAIDSLSESIAGLIGKVLELINLLPGVDIPNPFEQNSPSPFEQAVMDVTNAIDDLSNRAIPNYIRASSSIAAPQAQPTNTMTNTINMGGQTLNRGVDIITLQIALEQALRNVLQ